MVGYDPGLRSLHRSLLEDMELDMCCGLFLGNSLVLLCLLFLKIQNTKSTNLAGSLDGAPIHNTNSKTKTLSRD